MQAFSKLCFLEGNLILPLFVTNRRNKLPDNLYLEKRCWNKRGVVSNARGVQHYANARDCIDYIDFFDFFLFYFFFFFIFFIDIDSILSESIIRLFFELNLKQL